MRWNSVLLLLLGPLILSFSNSSCSNSTNLPYSALGRSAHLHLKQPGYLISLEKIKKEEAQIEGEFAHQGIVKFPEELLEADYGRHYQRYFDQKILDEARPLMVTHLASFEGNGHGPYFHFNGYKGHPRTRGEGLTEENTWKALGSLQRDLTKRLRFGGYTHVLVMCMGWNNDQHDAIHSYNELVERVMDANSRKRFKPLVIGMTWPSAWLTRSNLWVARKGGHVLSYFNKSDDADELGIVYLNWILHKAIPDAQPRRKVPVVAIGHSFGARAMSRAVYSRNYLVNPHPDKEPVDLFIGLQAAVSVNRYLGSPFRGEAYNEVKLEETLVVYTSSSNDRANLAARYVTRARNIGSKHGVMGADKSDKLDRVTVESNPPVMSIRPRPGIPLIVDAASFVKGVKREHHGDISPHNDILDAEMGQFVRSCIDMLD